MATLQSWFVGVGTVLLVLFVGIGGSTAVATDSNETPMQTQTGAVNTTLDVQISPGSISYTNPATIRGTLRTANGTPVANEQVRLEVENRTRLVETDGNGSFALQYRPRSAQTGPTDVTVRYTPAQSAVYRGDTATVAASVTQVTPTLTLDRSPTRLATGDELTVTTAVRVNGEGVSNVPVELRIGGALFKRVVTGSNGTVTTSIRLPPSVTTGEQTVTAVIPYEGRAIAGKRATASIIVGPEAAESSATVDTSGGSTEPSGSSPQSLVSQIRSFFTVPVIAALLTAIILLILEVIVRRLGLFSDATPESEGTETTVRTGTDEPQAIESIDDTPTSTDSPTDQMGNALAAGKYDSAVTMAYESVADDIRAVADFQNSKTHWELLAWCEDSALDTDQVDAVRTVVEAYDRAAFSADQMDRASAEAAVEHARELQIDSLS
ncbi:hypothetical protein RBH20_07160 [Haloarcula sp. H-GB4]|uniref:hypothetical protein n=1 Tax=Haloarcula sp. H-GB4 TaxID=3069755 RepID=UPI0027B6B518|nr:hypothetical protein [Haloarcula sp. H-GB4]MDQ2072319.1 hypothetical protein [Haloarcula sp. H-GB4]